MYSYRVRTRERGVYRLREDLRMEAVLGILLAYFISLAANERSAAIHKGRENALKEALETEETLRKALASRRSLREELRGACNELARNRDRLGVTREEEPLWRLLRDDVFQADLAEWLMAGGIEEGNAVKARLLATLERVLTQDGASPKRIEFLQTRYFDALDKAIFSHPALAHWRHQLSLDYLREQVAVLRKRADEAAGVYTPEKQKEALDHYCEKALRSWDIIELGNLPEGDISIVGEKLLRQLYVPLRIRVEARDRKEDAEAALAKLEEERDVRRHLEAGHGAFNASDETLPSVGERLDASHRLVVLGDPGGGKTTLLRWMATAYLLHYKSDPAFGQIPDTSTLPVRPWIPVLIRCRDIGPADLCRCFTDFLKQHLHKSELDSEDACVMQAVILDRVAKGEALLLVDGLDEITDPKVRMMFCQELELTAARYPDAPIVVTSRIVGYRDMPYRMGRGFEHGVIADLTGEDKDLFARRWVEVTAPHQTEAEKARRAQELTDAFHSSDRIERLTGNPMLLTTMALVKRKVGKLPNKRTKLYAEAVSVLLNWNPSCHEVIEEDEAMPQLKYIAYAMCQRGVQRLSANDILDLLDHVREEYRNIRAMRRRSSEAFLAQLEARSSILIKAGSIWDKTKSQEKAAWEFRHLTFQEYLAARALIDGCYPDRDKTKPLAEEVAGLAGAVEVSSSGQNPFMDEDAQVPESWREALRLLVADCKGDDVDKVLLAILNPMEGEDAERTARPRAVLAALCLADEPDVSDEVAKCVIARFAAKVEGQDGGGRTSTTLDAAAIELGRSMWVEQLRECLMEEYCARQPESRTNPGGLWGMVEVAGWTKSNVEPTARFAELVRGLDCGDRSEQASAALVTMAAAFGGQAILVPGLVDRLLALLESDPPRIHAAAWALRQLAGGHLFRDMKGVWSPNKDEVATLLTALDATLPGEDATRRWIIACLGRSGDECAVGPLIARIDDPDENVRWAVIEALRRLGSQKAVEPLIARIDDPDEDVQRAVVKALGHLGSQEAVEPLIARIDDPDVRVRWAVIQALGRLDSQKAVEPLIARIDDPDEDVRRAVVEALGNLGSQEAVEPLIARIDDPDVRVRWAVVKALGRLDSQKAVEPLIARIDDPDEDVQRAVVEALGNLGSQEAVEPLIARIDDPDVRARRAAVEALGRLGSQKAVEPLIARIDDPDERIRRAVVEALASNRSERDRILLSRDLDRVQPGIDPRVPIGDDRIANAARRLEITPEEVRAAYQALAADFHLTVE